MFVGNTKSVIAEAKKGLNSNNEYHLMNLKYKSGNSSAAFMGEYIKLKFSRSEISQANSIAEMYFNSLSAKQKSLPENWFLFGKNPFLLYIYITLDIIYFLSIAIAFLSFTVYQLKSYKA